MVTDNLRVNLTTSYMADGLVPRCSWTVKQQHGHVTNAEWKSDKSESNHQSLKWITRHIICFIYEFHL